MQNFSHDHSHLIPPTISRKEVLPDSVTPAEIRRQGMLEFQAMEDARNKAEACLARPRATKLDLAQHPELRLSSYIHDASGRVARALLLLAEMLQYYEALGFQTGTDEALAIMAAAAVLQDEAPIGLTQVVLSTRDEQIGEFILRVGDSAGLPVRLYMIQPGVTGTVELGWDGDIFVGAPPRTIQNVHEDFNQAVCAMVKIIKSKGLEACTYYRNPNFVLVKGRV